MTVFLRYYADREIESISIKEIEDFNNDFILKHGYSGTTQSQYISAIKVFYVVMLGINHEIDSMERPAKGRRLPKVIAKQDVERLLKNIRNRKHRMVLSTIYGLGLRRSELINLQLKDIDFNRNAILIFNSKGKKDRIVPFPAKLKKQMLEYISEYEPEKYLVEGREKGEKYSDTTIGKIFKKYADNVLKSNTFTPHSLRHSLATHLLDSGVDIRYIQELLGHKSSRTTEIYTHVSMRSLKEIRNPLDDFDI
jgi:site-specific recombinase XerD